jgi:hypothetical protein
MNAILALLCLGVAVVFTLGASGAVQVGDRATRGAHVLMGLGMAGMFWPTGDPTSRAVGAVVFAVVGLWFLAAWVRSGRTGVDGPAHVVVGCAAMVMMYLVHSHGDAAAGGSTGPAGHAGHAGADLAGGSGALVVALALLFAGYFVWHAWETVSLQQATSVPVEDGGRHRVSVRERVGLRAEPVAHVVMSVLMAAMLIGHV